MRTPRTSPRRLALSAALAAVAAAASACFYDVADVVPTGDGGGSTHHGATSTGGAAQGGGGAASSATVTTTTHASSVSSASSYMFGLGGGSPQCGDGVLQQGEQCDDGNLDNGDGCNSSCHLEVDPDTPCSSDPHTATGPTFQMVQGNTLFVTGDTTDATNHHADSAGCQGSNASDFVYTVHLNSTGILKATIVDADYGAIVDIGTTCPIGTSLVCCNYEGDGTCSVQTTQMSNNSYLVVVVDGSTQGSTVSATGQFLLRLDLE